MIPFQNYILVFILIQIQSVRSAHLRCFPKYHIICCPSCKDQRFQKRIACQTVLSMDTIAACLTAGIESTHGSPAAQICLNTSHKIVLCRNNRNRLFSRIKSVLNTVLLNVREMLHDRFFTQRTHIFPDKISTVLFHLLKNRLTEQIPWLQFIRKTLTVFVIKKCTFATDRF